MKLIKPIFYVLITLICVYLTYAIYISPENNVDTGAGFGITITFILSIISIAAAVIFPVVYMISHPKSAMRALVGVVLMIVVFGLGYALSGDEITVAYEKVGFDSAGASKLVGGSLKMMYIMIAAVLAVTVFSEVRKLFK